jgi:hypothetical protein
LTHTGIVLQAVNLMACGERWRLLGPVSTGAGQKKGLKPQSITTVQYSRAAGLFGRDSTRCS